MNRRQFLKTSALFGAGLFFPKASPLFNRLLQAPLHPTLNLNNVPKYQAELINPPAMPRAGVLTGKNGEAIDYYEIAMQQFQQFILPKSMNLKTTVWSYAIPGNTLTQNYPAFTIEAQHNRPVRVKWINDLIDPATGSYLPHLLPVDPTLHWANPAGPRDVRPTFTKAPEFYKGPVPIVTHVHGAHVGQESDGYPEAWFLPNAANIPAGYFKSGSFYDQHHAEALDQFGQPWEPGTAVFQYPNDQRAATLWYHDHSLGITRLNVYAGPAGFYLLRGGPDDFSDPAVVPAGKYEVPIAIQDRAFNADGSLFYPDARAYFDEMNGIDPTPFGGSIPYIPDSDIAPFWNPEFFGNVMVVNGQSWPVMPTERRRYRLRFLNGCNARFLDLKIVLKSVAEDPHTAHPAAPELTFFQIGSDGGLLPQVVERSNLLLAPAERADVIVDFTQVPAGTRLCLINEAPDEPFGGGVVGVDYEPANYATTGQVMLFDVIDATSADLTADPQTLSLPNFTPLGPAGNVTSPRRVSLNELDSEVIQDEGHPPSFYGPREAMLGCVDQRGMGMPMMWMDEVTESPTVGATEIWEIHNYTMDAHPIHLHLTMFQVVEREDMATHATNPPEPWESGYKDTVIAYPDQITRLKAHFDRAGRYVWHCHILEHEDNEMMRPYDVVYRTYYPIIGR